MLNPQEPSSVYNVLTIVLLSHKRLSEIFQSCNMEQSTPWRDWASWSCGTSSVFKHTECSLKSASIKWTVSEMYERCWWLEVHKSVVKVHLLMAANCSSTLPRTAMYFSGMIFVEKYVRWGSWNFGSAIVNKVRKLGSSTTLMGCRPWQIKSAVAPTSCLTRLLSLAYGTAIAIASCRVACCSPRCFLSFTSVTFLCSSKDGT